MFMAKQIAHVIVEVVVSKGLLAGISTSNYYFFGGRHVLQAFLFMFN